MQDAACYDRLPAVSRTDSATLLPVDLSVLRKAYDRDATGYDARFADQQRAKYEVIARHVPPPDSGVVLDLGGGTGMLKEALVANNAEWAGRPFVVVDVSRSMLWHARARGLDAVQADARRLPIRSGVASRVICVTGLVDASHVERALISAVRVCAQGGVIAFSLLPGTMPLDPSTVAARFPLVLDADVEAGVDRLLVWRKRSISD